MDQPYVSAGEGKKPVVVQGIAVPNKTYPVNQYDHGATTSTQQQQPMNLESGDQWTKGEKQPKRCNDAFFGLFFMVHLVVMAIVTAKYFPLMSGDLINTYNDYKSTGGGEGGAARRVLAGLAQSAIPNVVHYNYNAMEESSSTDVDFDGRALSNSNDNANDDNNDDNDGDYYMDVDPLAVVHLMCISGALAFLVNGLSIPFIMYFAEGLIKMALLFNVMTTLMMGVAGVYAGTAPMAILGFFFFAISAYYAFVVWGRIPFAAANLSTAVVAVRANIGLAVFAYSSLIVLFLWTIWWTMSFVSGLYYQMGCYGNNYQCQAEPNGPLVFLFLVSYYWTYQVVKNHLRVTVSGTVGTWWFAPVEASSCCSSAVTDSFVRATTTSFGSICFGSLVVAVIQAAREFLNMLRASGDDVLLCCAECCLSCIESLAEYFNQWAFVFVGLYGYSFLDAGKNVINLFTTRGWTTIITDNLVENVLLMVSGGAGIINGLISLLMATSGMIPVEPGIAFSIGFFTGLMLSAVKMGIIGSAVNTVIVCYAEAPAEFQQNHPELSDKMRAAWRQAWPIEFHY